MRALATISTVILLGASLGSCDMPGSHRQQAAVAPPCDCAPHATTTPAPPAAHPTRFSYAPRHHYIRHRYYAAEHHANYRYRNRYEIDRAQQSVDAYDYVSKSRVTRSDYSESGYSENGYASEYEGGYRRGGRIVWVDGYGRGYFSNGPVTVAATMRGKRLAPYHGYDVDCPDDGERR
jgi:hypothetical protein